MARPVPALTPPVWLALCLLLSLAGTVRGASQATDAKELVLRPHAPGAEPTVQFRSLTQYAREPHPPELAELALRLAKAINPDLLRPDPESLEHLKAILANDALPPTMTAVARELLAHAARSRGDAAKARKLTSGQGLVPAWQIIGPFGRYGRANFTTVYPPEMQPHSESPCEGSVGPVQWHPIPAQRCVPQTHPWQWVDPGYGVVYLAAEFTSADGARTVRLHATTDASLHVFLDGQPVLLADRIREDLPRDLLSSGVTLPAGRHRLLVKLYSQTPGDTVRIRILSEDLAPAIGLEWHAAPSAAFRPGTLAPVDPTPRPLPFLSALRQRPDPDGWREYTFAVLAEACLEQGLADEATRAPEVEVTEEPRPSHPQLDVLRARVQLATAEDAGGATEHAGVNATRAALEKAPDFVPALLLLAEYEQRRGRPVESARIATQIIDTSPGTLPAHLLRLELALRQNWTQEAREWTEQMLKIHDGIPAAHEAAARIARFLDDSPGVIESLEKLNDGKPGDENALLPLLAAQAEAGNTEAVARLATTLMDSHPSPRMALSAGRWMERVGLTKEAREAYLASLESLPEQPLARRLIGDLQLREGETEAALKSYQASLERSPEQHDLRRLVAHLKGTDTKFWTPYARDARQALAAARSVQSMGSTVRIIDQTVLTIYPDGSFGNFTHELQRVLSRGGIADAGSVPIQGEMLEARTLLPDGRELEPVRVPGKSDFTMPGVAVGSAVENKYLMESPAPFDHSFRFPKWYFRSPSLEEEFLLSEYIIRVPEGYPFVYEARNLDAPGNQVTFSAERKDGWIIYHWLAQRMPRPAHETGSLDIDEVLPHVAIGGRRSWRDINRLMMNAYLGRIRPTRQIRELAARLTRGAESARDRVERIHHFVCREIVETPTSMSADAILKARAGDRNLVLMALLRAADIPCFYAAVRPPESMLVRPCWSIPEARHFPLRLVVVEMEGKPRIWLDTRFPTLAADELLEETSGATALIVGVNRGEFVTIPPRAPSAFSVEEWREVEVLPGENQLRIHGRVSIPGTRGHARKEELRHASPRQETQVLEDFLSPSLPGLVTEELSHPEFALQGRPFQQAYTARVAGLLSTDTDSNVSIPLLLTPISLLPDADADPLERESSYHLQTFLAGHDRILIRWPHGAQPKAAPADLRVRNRFGQYHLRFHRREGGIEIDRRYEFAPQRILRSPVSKKERATPDDWEAFVEMARQIDRAERQRIVWSEAQPGRTNAP